MKNPFKLSRCIFVLLATALLGSVSAAEGPAAIKGKKLLLIGSVTDPNPKVSTAVIKNDNAIKARLEALGFVVTLTDQSEPASKSAGQDVVFISASIQANKFLNKYKDVPLPIVTAENDILDDMGMSGQRRGVDFGDVEKERHLWLVNAPHPLSAGLPAGTLNIYKNSAAMGWGRPGVGADIIATLPGQYEKAAIFGYEKGATMDYNFLAPARRVFLFIDFDTFENLNEDGLKLFDAAVIWAASKPAQ